MILLTVPSFAAAPAGTVQLAGITVAQALGLYVGCPVGLFVIIAGTVLLLTKGEKNRG
jgi:hypothetical protein